MGQNLFAPPLPTSEAASPSPGQLGSRFVWVFVGWALFLAILFGAVRTVQTAEPLAQFGGLEYVPRVTSLTAVRELGPGATASAIFFALIVWSHSLDEAILRARLLDIYPRALLTSLLSLPLVTAISAGVAMLAARTIYGVPWNTSWSAAVQIVEASDLVTGVAVFGVNAAIAGLISYFGLASLARRGWSLHVKIVTGWAVVFVTRTILSVILTLCGY